MANHKSAIKRDRQSKARRLRNSAYKTRAKNTIKELRLAIENKQTDEAGLSLKKTVSILQKVQSKGVIHKNTASRKISRLARKVNQLAAISSVESTKEKSDSQAQDQA